MTQQAEAPNGARSEAERDHIEQRLDAAIEESFPASDPPAFSLHDDPPVRPQEVAGDTAHARSRQRLIKRVLTGGAIAAAGVFVTRMLLRRSSKRPSH